MSDAYVKTACILCSVNCGIEARLEKRSDGGHITHVRGDREHPVSAGYLCQRAQRLDFSAAHKMMPSPMMQTSQTPK